LKMLRGNPSRKKPNENEPVPPSGLVEKPSVISGAAAVIWDGLAPICLAMGTLTVADVGTFRTLCELQATFDANTATKGSAVFDVKLERETANALRPYYALFGLEPVSRARISVPKKAEEPVSKWAGQLK
jgi:hypothetical protein